MSDILSTIKPAVKRLDPYMLKHFSAPVKINQNENPFDMPEVIKGAVYEAVASKAWSRYPEFLPSSLVSQLADFTQWTGEGILVGNGSNELIETLMVVTVEKGKRVVLPQPTFKLYAMFAKILGGECIEVSLKPDLEFNVEALVSASSRAALTIICSPNNPTGCMLRQTDLKEILQATEGLVVIDEAYHEFSRQSVVPLLKQFENLIVLRTFSKAMSMAGLRVGYLLGHPNLVKQISKAKLPYNLNVFSMTAAAAALKYFNLLQPQIDKVISERDRLCARLRLISGVEPFPSQANFIVFRLAIAPQVVFEALCQDGILVRNVSDYPMLNRFLRVSVGLPAENDQFVTSLSSIMNRYGGKTTLNMGTSEIHLNND